MNYGEISDLKKKNIDEVQKFEAAGRDSGVEKAALKTWFDAHRSYPAVITSPAFVQACGAPQWFLRQQGTHSTDKTMSPLLDLWR